MATNSKQEIKSSTSFESAFAEATSFETVNATVRFIKPIPNGRVMLLVQRRDKSYKCYGFFSMVEGLRAPFKAELLVEQRIGDDKKEYWNVTAVTVL